MTHCRILNRMNVEFVFHLAALTLYSRVWHWHTTPAALVLPGSTGFGWFFRYLTFWSYSLQLLQFLLCVLARVLPSAKGRYATAVAADRLSCAVFGLANTVTAMFYAIESTGKGLLDAAHEGKPWWLGETVHLLNSIIAWIDLFLVEDRTFHGHSRHLVVLVAISYCSWALLVRYVNGAFPYPVLNILPFPWGFLGFVLVGTSVLLVLFEFGKLIKNSVRAWTHPSKKDE